jgi:hypothetical protein
MKFEKNFRKGSLNLMKNYKEKAISSFREITKDKGLCNRKAYSFEKIGVYYG